MCCEDAIGIIENTNWVSPEMDVVKAARMRLFEPLGLDPPQSKLQQQKAQKADQHGNNGIVDENASYQALVNSMGY